MKRETRIVSRICIWLLMVAIVAGWLVLPVHAAETEVTIDLGREYTEAVFYVTWENYEQAGTVKLTSPSGKVYSKDKTPDQVYEANGEAIVNVGKGEEGTWTVVVSGDNIGTVDVTVGELPNSLVISKFAVTQNTDGSVTADYKITDSPDEIYVEIFADTDSEGFDGTCVYSEYMDKKGTASFDLNSLSSGEYHFYIRVSVDGIYQRAYGDGFVSYQNPNDSQKVNGVKGGTYNDGYYISWTAAENEAYTVLVWDENHNLIKEEDVGTAETFYGDFSEDASKVYLAVVRTNESCMYDLITADPAVKVSADVAFDTDSDTTKNSFINATMTLDTNSTFDVYLGERKILEGEKESGMYRVNLEDGDNTVSFVVTDETGNAAEFSKDIYVDTVPPQLSVSEDINGKVVTEGSIYLNGYTEAGAVLTLNGEPVELTQNYFNKKITLAGGENTITLIAEDAVGNQSVYSATITYESAKTVKRIFEYIALGGLVLVLLILYIIVFAKGRKRRKQS